MDTLTHALIGTAVSDGAFRKQLGRVATPFSLVVASLPDADIFTYFMSTEYAWIYHRGYTHSFFFHIIAAPVLGYIGYRIAGKTGAWLQWSLLAFLCLFTHTLGDLITSWGTMPLLPFSNARLSWDLAPILDIFLTGVSGASFVANRLLRREKVDTFDNPMAFPVVHRHPKRCKAAMWIARVSVGLICLYLLIAVQQNRQTVRVAREQLAASGVEAMEVRALPIMFSYIAWSIAARDADGNIYNALHSTYAPQPMEFTRHPTSHSPEADQALRTMDGQMFAWYAQNMFVSETNPTPGVAVRLADRRFFAMSNPGQSRFIMDFAKMPDGGLDRATVRQVAFEGMDVREELRMLWNLVKTGQPGAVE